MTELLTMDVGDGSDAVAVFEIAPERPGSDLDLAAGGHETLMRARRTLDEAMEQVKPTLSRVVQTLRELGPDQAEIEFGLKIGGDTSVIIAKGTAEVNFAVRLQWNRS